MTSKPALTPKAAAHLANMIERTERRGAILADLVDVCVNLSKKLARDMLDGPFHPESRHDTARAFDVVTRSLRLTLAMEERVDAHLFALHNGELPVDALKAKPRRDAGGTPAVQEGFQAPAGSESDHETPEVDRRESETERLVESERLCFSDFRANVDALRANVGLKPDPSLWAKEEEHDRPPSPEVGRADSRLPAASRVGGERDAGGPGETCEDDSPQHRNVPPPGSGLQARVRPPHFGGGMVLDLPDPPPRE